RGWLDRLRSGDPAARDELLRACRGRFEALARKMLRRYPSVQRWADTGDVFQNAALRLLRALDSTPLADTRQVFHLVAPLTPPPAPRPAARPPCRAPGAPGATPASPPPAAGGRGAPGPPAPAEDPATLDRWAALHEAVEGLPAEEREVFGLRYYHRWEEATIA